MKVGRRLPSSGTARYAVQFLLGVASAPPVLPTPREPRRLAPRPASPSLAARSPGCWARPSRLGRPSARPAGPSPPPPPPPRLRLAAAPVPGGGRRARASSSAIFGGDLHGLGARWHWTWGRRAAAGAAGGAKPLLQPLSVMPRPIAPSAPPPPPQRLHEELPLAVFLWRRPRGEIAWRRPPGRCQALSLQPPAQALSVNRALGSSSALAHSPVSSSMPSRHEDV